MSKLSSHFDIEDCPIPGCSTDKCDYCGNYFPLYKLRTVHVTRKILSGQSDFGVSFGVGKSTYTNNNYQDRYKKRFGHHQRVNIQMPRNYYRIKHYEYLQCPNCAEDERIENRAAGLRKLFKWVSFIGIIVGIVWLIETGNMEKIVAFVQSFG